MPCRNSSLLRLFFQQSFGPKEGIVLVGGCIYAYIYIHTYVQYNIYIYMYAVSNVQFILRLIYMLYKYCSVLSTTPRDCAPVCCAAASCIDQGAQVRGGTTLQQTLARGSLCSNTDGESTATVFTFVRRKSPHSSLRMLGAYQTRHLKEATKATGHSAPSASQGQPRNRKPRCSS